MSTVENCEKERHAKEDARVALEMAITLLDRRDYIGARRALTGADNMLLNAGVWKASKEDCP